jgi:hypothetical protein
MTVSAFFDKTVLQLHCDGANNATTCPDSSGSAHSMTVRGAAHVTTADSVFGGACFTFGGSGDAVDTPGHADFQFGTGDFMVQGRLKTTDVDGGIVDYFTASQTGSWQVYMESGKLAWYKGSTRAILSSSFVNTGAWVAFEFSRIKNLLTLRLNGVAETTVFDNNNYNYNTSQLSIGRQFAGSPNVATDLIGKVDEVRIVKGDGVYTDDYTIETAAFGDSQATVSGVIRDSSGTPCSRTVRAYSRASGALVGNGTSDATTGAYSLAVRAIDEVTILVLDDAAGTLQNDLVARVIP